MTTEYERPLKVLYFGTHPHQFNGYSKVVYEICKTMAKRKKDGSCTYKAGIDFNVFGFQAMWRHVGHRQDVPKDMTIYDALAGEEPRQQGFGFAQAKEYVTKFQPDVCIVFNDMVVLSNILNEIRQAPNRPDFKIIAYIDQVYLCQRRDLMEFVNQTADAAILFTPEWRECAKWQGITIPAHVLVHGFNPATYFPVPKNLARRFFSLPESDFLVLNLNRNQPRKRWDTCLQAFADVVARRPDAPIKFVIGTDTLGAWNLVELYQRELKKRGVNVEKGMERLVVPGHPQMLTDEETNILYNVADVGINTCDGEGFGLCNFEQAAIGIPQIVPRIGGFLHFFDDETATLVDPVTSLYVDASRDSIGGEAQITDWKPYADAIIRYYDDAALRVKHGTNARESILAKFPWDTVVKTLEGILERVYPSDRLAKQKQQQEVDVSTAAPPPSLAPSPSVTTAALDALSVLDAEQLLNGGGEEVLEDSVDADAVDVVAPSPTTTTTDTAAPSLSAAELEELRILKARMDQLLSRG